MRCAIVWTVYVPLEVAAQTGLPAILPRVFSDNEQPQIEMLLGEAMSRGTDTVLAGNIGHIRLPRGGLYRARRFQSERLQQQNAERTG